MNYQVKIDDQIFLVEVINIHQRPIRVLVDGECFEIWPEGSSLPQGSLLTKSSASPQATDGVTPALKTGLNRNGKGEYDRVKAPIPGTILSIAVRPGDSVQQGQELCVLEAMKMKNLIRSPREGVIALIHVIPGQNVSHGDTLMEFELKEDAG